MIVEQNPWLVTILCVNHRLELAIKDAISDINKFQDCDKFYLPLFFSFWKLWQIENSNQKCCRDNKYYLLSPTQNPWFVNHCCYGFTKLVHDCPTLISGFENVLATDKGCHGETGVKVQCILKKLNSYKFLCQVVAYLNVLESIGLQSLVKKKHASCSQGDSSCWLINN